MHTAFTSLASHLNHPTRAIYFIFVFSFNTDHVIHFSNSTVDDTTHDTFEGAARGLGTVSGNKEFGLRMQEPALFRTACRLRALFVTLILHGAPAAELQEQCQHDITKDYFMHLTPEDACTTAYREFDLRLQKHDGSKVSVGLPVVTHVTNETDHAKFQIIPSVQADYANDQEPFMTYEQRAVYDAILAAVQTKPSQEFMVDAKAGTGKTFTEKIIAACLRCEGKILLIVASSGIAAFPLPGGWTAYSMFCLPLDDGNLPCCVCSIPTDSQRADCLRACDFIIWDEVPMVHRFSVQALDLTLQDIMKSKKPFGAKCVIFSGDMRQTGPIV